MPADLRDTSIAPGTNRYLLENQAIWADTDIRVNYDAVWMRQQKSPSDLAVDWNICTRHYAPEAMSQYGRLPT